MALKLKQHVISRVVACLKNQCSQLPSVLPQFVEIHGGDDSSNIEFHLNLRSLEKFNGFRADYLPNLENISSDSLIHGVWSVTDKRGPKCIFRICSDVFLKEVLEDVINKPNLIRKRNSIVNNHIGRRIVVEFSSPNIAKPFHVGHLRSTVIGNFISKLHEYLTFDVLKLNYLGDWGTQMGLLAVGLDMLKYSDDVVKQNPIGTLYEAYVTANKEAEHNPEIHVQARKIFEQMENADSEELGKWQLFRKYSVNELEKTYRRLGIKYDDFHWESMYRAKHIGWVMEMMEENGFVQTQEDGKCVIDLNGRKVTIVKSDGSMLYLTRDIAAAIERYRRFNFDEMIYVVENGQSDHLSTLFTTLKKLGLPWAHTLKHVKFGRIHGMSTRRGQTVFLKDVLDEAELIMKNKQNKSATTRQDMAEDTADVLGMSAVIINDLKQRRLKDYEFNWNKALQVEGDTGIRLQYTHCRLWNLEKNSGASLAYNCDPSVLNELEAIVLVREIARFEEVLLKTYSELEACHLVQYLFHICNAVNKAFNVLQVKDQGLHIASQRLMMFHAARIVLNQGMRILGLKPLEEM
ncbi:probable arginine--tRNA ligase, mitochondrial isoform X2 [Schistocerca nitens]|uniref:probable arginine--tRNA ligase, mitochondrial isoform X2 n=1 Tax=Schistocerca nitens TaxID=7011 RepID=UPI002118CD00|nr:probable arginine--tRNA ligase, mitochondrial isoform X2 [Schistocerca nitens]